jgi:Fe-S cluster assembly iron-binding protein IscA
MVILTEQAAAAVKALTQQPDLPVGAGLRIAADQSGANQLALRVEEGPGPGDAVVESHGAMVFLDQTASAALDHMALDARADAEGRVSFTIEEQMP